MSVNQDIKSYQFAVYFYSIYFLQTQAHSVRIVQFEDGTEVTDDCYLKSLPSQTVFVALEHQEDWTPAKTGILDVDALTLNGCGGLLSILSDHCLT